MYVISVTEVAFIGAGTRVCPFSSSGKARRRENDSADGGQSGFSTPIYIAGVDLHRALLAMLEIGLHPWPSPLLLT